MYKYVYEFPDEICGGLDISPYGVSREITIDSYVQGKTDNRTERKLCVFDDDSSMEFRFHTHPLSSKPYPSLEDILFMGYKLSVVTTSIGVWVLDATNVNRRVDETTSTNVKVYLDKIYLLLKNHFGKTANITKSDMLSLPEVSYEEMVKEIERICTRIQRHSNVSILFLDAIFHPINEELKISFTH
jgi:hypothetical protein